MAPEPAETQPSPTLPRFYRVPELCQLLNKSTHSLQRWRSSGEGPRFVKAGNTVLYRESDLLEWLEEHSKRSTSSPARTGRSVVEAI
jgi:predicted DNA-binding transcriptional regulator AlpA